MVRDQSSASGLVLCSVGYGTRPGQVIGLFIKLLLAISSVGVLVFILYLKENILVQQIACDTQCLVEEHVNFATLPVSGICSVANAWCY